VTNDEIAASLAAFEAKMETRLDRIERDVGDVKIAGVKTEFQATRAAEQGVITNGTLARHAKRLDTLEDARSRIEGALALLAFLLGGGVMTAMAIWVLS
jgi:hypothetical protein